jgi:hypothetical protein
MPWLSTFDKAPLTLPQVRVLLHRYQHQWEMRPTDNHAYRFIKARFANQITGLFSLSQVMMMNLDEKSWLPCKRSTM